MMGEDVPNTPRHYWYTAEEIVETTARGLEMSQAEALRWLDEGVRFLPDAYAHGDLERCLQEPLTSIDERWDTIIAACIRYKLRLMGVDAPDWTWKEPLAQMWFVGGVLPHRVASTINLAPAELRRVGIMMPAVALEALRPRVDLPRSEGGSRSGLDRDLALAPLSALGAQLHEQGLVGHIHVVGGAAIALTLRDARVTPDVDAVVLDHPREFRAAAEETARQLNIPENWISDTAAACVGPKPGVQGAELTLPGLTVAVGSPEHLLALKVRAATERPEERDTEDVVFLTRHLGLATPTEVSQLTEQHFQAIYRDPIGYDEYVATVMQAFVVHDLQH